MSSIAKSLERIQKRRKALKKLMKRKRLQSVIAEGMARRRKAEKRFEIMGLISVSIACIFLLTLLFNIVSNGYTAFMTTEIMVPITFDSENIESGDYYAMVKNGLEEIFPGEKTRSEKLDLYRIISKGAAYKLQKISEDNSDIVGTTKEIWLKSSSDVDMLYKGKISEGDSHLSENQKGFFNRLVDKGRLKKSFNTTFFTSGDSREPELAGMLGSIVGSLFVVISCMFVAFPLGVLTAIYLEEFAPKNKITDFIEVNINNLAAVPSIVFGLLGLAVYIQIFGIPRSASLAGGLTLAMMAMPVIVIATRTSIKAIPQSIRDGAMAIGASKVQVTMHHVLPLAMPGIMTGAILSIARILGETAPLIMIGMVAFVVDVPSSFLSPATAMPVQIYLWADSAEQGFIEKTSAAIIVLLMFLIAANSIAAYVRKKFEIRW